MITQETFKKLKPMLATSSPPFNSKEYIFEVKWDGFRCLGYLGESTLLQSRNGLDFSCKFPELASINRHAKQRPLVVDGEIVVLDGGVPSFYELQKRGRSVKLGTIATAAARKPATYVVFDILYASDDKLTSLPLSERREILGQLIEGGERIFVPEGIYERGVEFYRACIERDLEGVVAKKLDSPYVPGKRSLNWKKFKKVREGDFVICGYKQTNKASERVDALLLGRLSDGGPVFQGMVGVGLGGVMGTRVYQILEPLRRDMPLFKIPREISRGLNWVNPAVSCAVKFLEPARDGGLRHPVFRGLREDLEPEDCTGIAGAMGEMTVDS